MKQKLSVQLICTNFEWISFLWTVLLSLATSLAAAHPPRGRSTPMALYIPFIPSLYTMALYTLPLLCFISYSESEPLVTQFVQVSQTWLSPKVYTLVRYMASIKIDGSMQIPFIMCTLFRDNRIQWQQSKKVSSSLTIGLQQLPSSGSIIPKLGLVGVHQPLRVGHRLVHVSKVFKVEVSLWGGEDPFETLRSVQFILCL